MDKATGMFRVQHTVGTVLCCKCGTAMTPNAANMCVNCLRTEVDITEDLDKNVVIKHCPECDCYLHPPRTWIKAQPESKKLLTFCVKKIKNINKVRFKHAEFIWTEPHSKRLKIRIRVQKEVLNGAVLEQACIVEYVVQDHMCDSCSREHANPDQWGATVQLRQNIVHRRTLLYLEQIIIRHDAASDVIRIRQMERGIDFFFATQSQAMEFIKFLGKYTVIKSRHDKQLVSHDFRNNKDFNKHTYSVEICPICREDLVLLPPSLCKSLGDIGPLVICTKVSNTVALLDPNPKPPRIPRLCYLDAEKYFRAPFNSLLSSKQLVEYIVLDIVVKSEHTVAGSKILIADAQVARVSDFGKNDTIFNVETHLGHILNPCDYALGYDLYGANTCDIDTSKYRNFHVPEVVLVKKSYEEQRQKKHMKPRPWKLKSLNMELDGSKGGVDEEKMNLEYEEFLRDLEENPDMRFNISLYRNNEYQQSESASVTDGEDAPSVPLHELLGDLDLNDEEIGENSMNE